MSKLETNTIDNISGSSTLTIGSTNTTGINVGSPISNGLTLSDNILFDTASKGIYLGVTTPTASNLLDDYEEGTWTPTNATVSFTEANGTYTKIGNTVILRGRVTYPSTASSSASTISGLPFTAENFDSNFIGSVGFTTYGSDNLYPFVFKGTTSMLVRNNTNSDIPLSSLSTKLFSFFATYQTTS